MSFAAIKTKAISRVYESYVKPEGLWNSIRGFWDRKYIQKTALHPTDLEIAGGQIIGLVGANGAGKTTLLKLLSGLIHPSSGEAEVLGFHPWERKHDFLRQISILLGQKNQLWWDISAQDSYSLLMQIYNLDVSRARKRVHEIAEVLQCSHVLDTQLRRLSLGERMKMEIIGCLLHDPKIIFLDEPTIGLDVLAQNSIRSFIADHIKGTDKTVILTSHYMDDIAKLSDRLMLMSQGKLVYDGSVNQFIAKTESTQKLSVTFSDPLPLPVILDEGNSIDQGARIYTGNFKHSHIPKIIATITQQGSVQDLKLEEADFEDVIRRFFETESRVR